MQSPDGKFSLDSVACRFCGSPEQVRLVRSLVKDVPRKAASPSGEHIALCGFCRKRFAHFSFEFFTEAYENSSNDNNSKAEKQA